MKFRVQRIIDSSALQELLSAPDLLQAKREEHAMLVQIYASPQDRSQIATIAGAVQQNFPSACIIGASTVGEILEGETLTGSTLVLISLFENTRLQSQSIIVDPNDPKSQGMKLGHWVSQQPTAPKGMLLLATPLSMNVQSFLHGLGETSSGYPVFGGGAGDYAAMQEAWIYADNQFMTCAAVAVLFISDVLVIECRQVLGWQSIGQSLRVTQSSGMSVQGINHMRALDMYRRYIHAPEHEDFAMMAAEFPFLLERNGKLLARVPIGRDSDGALQFMADMQEGESFRLGYGDPHRMLEDVGGMQQDLQRLLPECLLLFVCGCRRYLLQEDSRLETITFAHLGHASGFYTYGEFYSDAIGHPQLLNASFMAVAMREGPLPQIQPAWIASTAMPKHSNSTHWDPYAHQHSRVIASLVHFIGAVTCELEEANATLHRLSITDHLTGLFNRVHVEAMIERTLASMRRKHESSSLLMLDVDYFKKVNDQFGHETGDHVLKTIATLMQQQVRSSDTVARWGGEEFMIILPHTEVSGALCLAEKIRSRIESTAMGRAGSCTVSIGLTAFRPEDSRTDVVERADSALYQAKNSGRNRVIAHAQ